MGRTYTETVKDAGTGEVLRETTQLVAFKTHLDRRAGLVLAWLDCTPPKAHREAFAACCKAQGAKYFPGTSQWAVPHATWPALFSALEADGFHGEQP